MCYVCPDSWEDALFEALTIRIYIDHQICLSSGEFDQTFQKGQMPGGLPRGGLWEGGCMIAFRIE